MTEVAARYRSDVRFAAAAVAALVMASVAAAHAGAPRWKTWQATRALKGLSALCHPTNTRCLDRVRRLGDAIGFDARSELVRAECRGIAAATSRGSGAKQPPAPRRRKHRARRPRPATYQHFACRFSTRQSRVHSVTLHTLGPALNPWRHPSRLTFTLTRRA